MLTYLTSINTNTKTRRLGYLKLLSIFLEQKGKVALHSLPVKFEEFSIKYENDLTNYRNSKGLIKRTKTGISARPYIELARELDLVGLLSKFYTPSKTFRVYIQLRVQFEKDLSSSMNVFELSPFDKAFYLEAILRKDFLYIWSILKLLKNGSGSTAYAHLVATFQQAVIGNIENLILELRSRDRLQNTQIHALIDRISSWRKPEVYLEHILMPRLNWLYDLGLVEINLNTYRLTLAGEEMLCGYDNWMSRDGAHLPLSENLASSFMSLFDQSYHEGISQTIEESDLVGDTLYALDTYITESFTHFQTLAPNRVTASQAINYAKYKFYFINQLVIDFATIQRYLGGDMQKKFIYKFQSQYGDGYIQLKQKPK